VYVNNKRVYLTATELDVLLTSYAGGNVKSIEVITTPPARYDADVAVVLNINTSKGVSLGYKGSITTDYTIGTFAKHQLGTSYFYRNDWLNVYANYNYNPRKDFKEDEAQIGFFSPDGSRNARWFVDFEKVHRQDTHSGNAVIDITRNESSTLDISANYVTNNNQEVSSNSQTVILAQDATTFSGFNANAALGGNRSQGFLNGGWDYIINTKKTIRLEGN